MTTLILLTLLAQDKKGAMGPDRAPKVGDEAPNFKLKRLGDPDVKKEVELKSFKGQKPVVLVFGSYT